MKNVIYIFLAVAIILIIYNLTYLDFSNLLEGESSVAVIGILTASCAVILMLILRASKIIEKKKK